MREATKTHEEIPPLSYDPAHIHRLQKLWLLRRRTPWSLRSP